MRTWCWKFILRCSSVCVSTLFKHHHHHTGTYPLHHAPNEKALHVLTCTDASLAQVTRILCSSTVQNHLQTMATHPDFFLSIPELLRQIQAGLPIHFSQCLRSVHWVLWAQALIGWTNFLTGRWNVEWFCFQGGHQITTTLSPANSQVWI